MNSRDETERKVWDHMEFLMKQAEISEAEDVARLIQDVWERMEQKDWYVADNAEYTAGMMRSGKGIVYKAVEPMTGTMAAVFMVTFPGDGEENLGRDIGLSGGELERVVHMESMAVLPEYRGNHLQRRMMQAAETGLKDAGYRYLMGTVHPDNQFSRNNFLSQGYQIVMTKEKYGGYLRDIFLKEI